MKQTIFFLALLFACSLAAKDDPHPIEKVVTLLKDLSEQVESEGKAEAVSFSKFEYWCKNSLKTLQKAIEEEKASISSTESTIEGKTKEKEALEIQIGELEETIAKYQASSKKADDTRKDGEDAYVKAKEDLEATATAIEDAIKALEEAGEKTSSLLAQRQVSKLLTLVEAHVTAEEHEQLKRFAREGKPDVKAKGDKAAHVKKYSFKSGNVIELLKSLLMNFEDQITECEKEETNAVNAYTLAKKARNNAEDAAEASKNEKEDILGATEETLEQAKSDLKDSKETLEADTASLEDTSKECSVKKSEWNERSAARSQELEAIATAIKILAKVGGVRTEKPDNPSLPTSPVSFLQVSGSDDPKMKAVNLLRSEAKVVHSKALERLAQEVATHLTGPFDQVNQMIQKMIFRLMAEQKDEDDHKNWCDMELEKTDEMIEDKEEKLDDLETKIESSKAKVQNLNEEIKEAEDMISEITSHVAESTDMRTEAKNENEASIKDAQAAQQAIANAISVLTEFYKKQGMEKEESELIQKKAKGVDLPEKPSTWDSGYSGVADPKKQPDGIITILKETASEFAEMEGDTKAQEAMDQKTFEEDMKACTIEKARRTKETEMKGQEKKKLGDKIEMMTKQVKHTTGEFEATKQYLKDLQPACVDGDSSYEERKEARSTEIDALKKAQKILKDAFKAEPEEESSSSSFLQRRQHK